MSTLDQGLFQRSNHILKDNSGRRKAATVVCWILLGISTLILISYGLQHLFLLKAQSGSHITMKEANQNDLRIQILALVYLLAYIATGVIFILWFRRAYYNIHQLGIKYLNFAEGWAAGAWFVPFLNLVRPFQIMREIWEEMQLYIRKVDKSFPNHSNLILAFWWVLFLLGNIASWLAERLMARATGIEQALNANIFLMSGSLMSIVSLGLLLKILHQSGTMEDELREAVITMQEQEEADETEGTQPYSIAGDR